MLSETRKDLHKKQDNTPEHLTGPNQLTKNIVNTGIHLVFFKTKTHAFEHGFDRGHSKRAKKIQKYSRPQEASSSFKKTKFWFRLLPFQRFQRFHASELLRKHSHSIRPPLSLLK
jgi:hypothetical protein